MPCALLSCLSVIVAPIPVPVHCLTSAFQFQIAREIHCGTVLVSLLLLAWSRDCRPVATGTDQVESRLLCFPLSMFDLRENLFRMKSLVLPYFLYRVVHSRLYEFVSLTFI
jgi:hypothetical protein